MDQQQTTPTLAQVMGTLDELAAAARAADADRYRAAVRLAQRQQITEEQQRDAYHWGRQGAARTFDWRGEQTGQENTPNNLDNIDQLD